MAGKLRGKLTYANVMVTLLGFIVLGGGAYAATHLKKNSVGGNQIKANAVTGAKVKNQSLTGSDIKASTLGLVPNATGAVNADNAVHTANSDNATHAANSDALQGHPAPDFGAVMSSLMTGAPGLLGTNTLYAPVSGIGSANGNPIAAETLSPQTALIARDLSVQLKVPPGDATLTVTVALRVNGNDTDLSCAITGTNQSCSDTTHAASVPPGSKIVLKMTEVAPIPGGLLIPAEYALTGFRLTPN